MPEIVIVDEIGTEAEALACRTIAERGVQVGVVGAHAPAFLTLYVKAICRMSCHTLLSSGI
jgi:stage III sporulation protein SpoIIIAA